MMGAAMTAPRIRASGRSHRSRSKVPTWSTAARTASNIEAARPVCYGPIVILRSDRLAAAGFAHGFSTRRGGVSTGSFASLNLARTVGDSPDAVAENLRRFAAELGVSATDLYWASQVHGADVVVLAGAEAIEDVRRTEADALVTAVSGSAVGVRTADCVPVLLGDPASGRVAAIHAGWRGVVRGVVAAALRAFRGGPGTIAAVGPAIGPCCFEVGADVAEVIT